MLAPFLLLLLAGPPILGPSARSAVAELRPTVDSLFSAMRRSDSGAVRALFVPTARVIPFPAEPDASAPGGLTVDAFVRFAAQNAPGFWDERVAAPVGSIDGTLGVLWFSYAITRPATPLQCGTNSVQLIRTTAGWRMVSMSFTSRSANC